MYACSSDPSVLSAPATPAPVAAKLVADIAVSSTSPDSATQDTTLDVVVNGSGFTSGVVATWALSGVADPTQVKTNSTRYVNAKQIVANITISKTASIGKWDVMVSSTSKTGIGSELFMLKPANPTTTWKLPLSDAGLSLKSDRQYGDGTYSVYASGTCGVSGTLFIGSGSGDATSQTSTPTKTKCGRVFTIAYPDGITETLASFINLNKIDNSSYSIPVGSSVSRRFVINPGVVAVHPTRCGRLIFGMADSAGAAVGSDSVLVTRVDASTWQIHSQAPPHDHAYCETTGQLFEMQVSLLVLSSYPVP